MSNQHQTTRMSAVAGDHPAGLTNVVDTGKRLTEYLKSKGQNQTTWGRRFLPKRK